MTVFVEQFLERAVTSRSLWCHPLNAVNKGMAWERSREKAGLAGMLVMEAQRGKELQRNPDKVSSHLQLHPFVFPQLLPFPSGLCVYSTQPGSMFANSASVPRLGPCVALER